MRTFSANGSPTCTAGSLRSSPSSKVAEPSTDTPPMPSRPVREPNRMTLLPVPEANARWRSSTFSVPTHSALTSGLPVYAGSKTVSPPMLGRPRQLP